MGFLWQVSPLSILLKVSVFAEWSLYKYFSISILFCLYISLHGQQFQYTLFAKKQITGTLFVRFTLTDVQSTSGKVNFFAWMLLITYTVFPNTVKKNSFEKCLQLTFHNKRQQLSNSFIFLNERYPNRNVSPQTL